MTYMEYISQFEILEKQVGREGYHYHHIIPRCAQKQFGLKDDHGVLITPAQHLWAHILYDQERGTNTAANLIGASHIKKVDIHYYEDCLPYNLTAMIQAKKASECNRGRSLPEETRMKISKTLSGENHPLFGKHLPEETRMKISESNKGKIRSQEARKKMSIAKKGKKPWNYGEHYPEETCKKISQAQLGENNVWYGFHWYNNGLISIRAKECPEGFVVGRLRRTK